MTGSSDAAGALYLIVGPSGAGKDTLLQAARRTLAADPRFVFCRRDITRPANAGGEDHRAVAPAAFEARRRAGAYALSWRAHGLRYGAPATLWGDLAFGRRVVLSGSRAVLPEARLLFPRLKVIEITAPAAVLARRLSARGRETARDRAERAARAAAFPVAGADVVRIVNDGAVEAGADALVAALQAPVNADLWARMNGASRSL